MSDILDSVREFYNVAGSYFSITRRKSYGEKGNYTWPEMMPYLARVKKGDRVLDLGCGDGRLISGLPKDAEYLGIDFSSSLLNEAKKQYPKHEFQVGDVTEANTYNKLGKYDAIFCVAVLHHLPEQKQQLAVLKNAKRHLAKNGFLYVSIWNTLQPRFARNHLDSWRLKLRNWRWLEVPFQNKYQRFCFSYDKKYVTKLVKEAGLEIEKIEYMDREGEATIWVKGRNLVAIVH